MDFYFDVMRCAVVAARIVPLRVIISKQFGSSTLLHGFESSPHMVASISRAHSWWTVDWERAAWVQTSRKKYRNCVPWMQSALLSAHILFMCKWKTQHHRIKSKCQMVNDSTSFLLSHLLRTPVSDALHCILIVLCAWETERKRKRHNFFRSFFAFFLFVFASNAPHSTPSSCVCVSAEWHLIYRLSVRKQVHTRPHSTALARRVYLLTNITCNLPFCTQSVRNFSTVYSSNDRFRWLIRSVGSIFNTFTNVESTPQLASPIIAHRTHTHLRAQSGNAPRSHSRRRRRRGLQIANT